MTALAIWSLVGIFAVMTAGALGIAMRLFWQRNWAGALLAMLTAIGFAYSTTVTWDSVGENAPPSETSFMR